MSHLRVLFGLDAAFLDARQLQIEKLETECALHDVAFEHGDTPRLRETAHTLSGLVSPFSTVAGQLASELEEHAARGDLKVSTIVEKLAAIAPDLMREVGELSVDGLSSTVA